MHNPRQTEVKCHQYWPSEGSSTYGNLEVTLKEVENLKEYWALRQSGRIDVQDKGHQTILMDVLHINQVCLRPCLKETET